MLKRETLFAVLPVEQQTRIRELVSFRARILTISQLVPNPYAQQAARKLYEVTGGRAPGGTQSPCSQVLVIYRSLSNRVTLNALYNEFMDLRASGVLFEDSLICVYRRYRQRVGWLVDENQLVTFDHWHVVARELETRESRLVRCTCCSSRNLLTKHTSLRSLECVFCDLLETASKKSTQRRESPQVASQKKVA
jgi:hypothetical protein